MILMKSYWAQLKVQPFEAQKIELIANKQLLQKDKNSCPLAF